MKTRSQTLEAGVFSTIPQAKREPALEAGVVPIEASRYSGGKKKHGSQSIQFDPVHDAHPKQPRSKTCPVVSKNLPLSTTGASAGIPAGDNGAAAAAIPQAGVRAVAEGIGEEGNHRPPLESEVVKNLTAVMKGDTVQVECGAAYYQLKVKQDGVVKFSVSRNKELVDSILAELPAGLRRSEPPPEYVGGDEIPTDYGEDESVAAGVLLDLKYPRAFGDQLH